MFIASVANSDANELFRELLGFVMFVVNFFDGPSLDRKLHTALALVKVSVFVQPTTKLDGNADANFDVMYVPAVVLQSPYSNCE